MKFLVVQTAFLGDVVLATPIANALVRQFPDSEIHFLVRKGNEGVLKGHPNIGKVHVWDKKKHKYPHLFALIKLLRAENFDWAINCQRFFNSAFLSLRVAKKVTGFDKSPLAFMFSETRKHEYRNGLHEVDRNLSLIDHLVSDLRGLRPSIHPSEGDAAFVSEYQKQSYFVIAPASVWETKQLPVDKWIDLISRIGQHSRIYLIGGPSDVGLCQSLVVASNVANLAGKLSLLQSAALMKGAKMNYTNDSGPTHMASAVNAPITTVFCSTTPFFGFAPLSDVKRIAQRAEPLDCRPCGIHGKKKCPEGHFLCAKIKVPV